MIGSVFLVEGTREEAERFSTGDPFHSAEVWRQVDC